MSIKRLQQQIKSSKSVPWSIVVRRPRATVCLQQAEMTFCRAMQEIG
jgi:hypothetical protein